MVQSPTPPKKGGKKFNGNSWLFPPLKTWRWFNRKSGLTIHVWLKLNMVRMLLFYCGSRNCCIFPKRSCVREEKKKRSFWPKRPKKEKLRTRAVFPPLAFLCMHNLMTFWGTQHTHMPSGQFCHQKSLFFRSSFSLSLYYIAYFISPFLLKPDNLSLLF